MKEINWGIIGTGDVTEVKSGPGLYKGAHSNLIGVFNRHYEKAEDYAKRHKVAKVFKTSEALVDDPDIDVVYIATPPKYHKDYAIQVLNGGKIPYIEKPLTMTYAEAVEIKNLASQLQIPVYVAFYRRGLQKFIDIKAMIDRQVIGDVKYVTVSQTAPVAKAYLDKKNLPWRVVPEISGGGLFLDIGSHVLDCLTMFFGEMAWMKGTACNTGGYYDAEDTVVASFQFKNGIVGTGTWCFVSDRRENMVEIVGDKGRIVYDGLSVKNFRVIVDGEEKVYNYEQPKHIAMPYEQAIVNELLGLEKSLADFDQAVNLVQMMCGVLDTAK